MADYYSLLSRAVSNLPKPSPASARRAIYDRARKALIGQLRSLKPALPESDIAREENALDAAVNRLEAEFEPSAAAPPPIVSPPPPPRPVAPARPQAPLRPPTIAPRTAAAPSQASSPAVPAPAAGPTAAAVAPARAVPPVAPAARPPAMASSPTRSAPQISSAARPAPPVAAASRQPPSASSAPGLAASSAIRAGEIKTAPSEGDAAAPPVSADAALGVGLDNAPRIGSPGEAAAPRAEADAARPGAPGRARPRADNPWPWIALAVVIGLVAAVAVLAFLFRQRPQDLAIKEPVETTPTAAPTANGPKIAERVGGPAAPAPSETPSPNPMSSPPSSPSPAASAAPTPGVPAPAASPAPSPSIAAQTEVTSLPVTARAAMLVATAADAQKPAVTVGTVVWSAVPALPGQPGSVGVKADVDIVDLKMHATMTLRKNTDSALPASHTIDLRLSFEDGSSIKGVKDIDLPRMRRDDSPEADPLLGVKVKINDTYFLIGLNRADPDIARNVDEIGTRGWFDFPLLLNDDRIAKLTFEKGADGDKIVSQAIAAWKQP